MVFRYRKLKQVKKRLKKEAFKTGGLYSFYTFEVTSIKKAPKGIVIGHKMHLYEVDKPKKKEKICKFSSNVISTLFVGIDRRVASQCCIP